MTVMGMTPSVDYARQPGETEIVSAHRLRTLLEPFLPGPLNDNLVASLSLYLGVLLRWNARLNLSAVREPEYIVTRHIGESLFAAARLLPAPNLALRAIDVGSGAGFPGLPLKIYAPRVHMTLIESQHKKATFLKEVIRALCLADIEVLTDRAEKCTARADLVTLRAVERFEEILPIAATLLRTPTHGGEGEVGEPRLALLIGSSQVAIAQRVLAGFGWREPIPMPLAKNRVLLVGALSAVR